MVVRVTDHAVVRALERAGVAGDSGAIRRQLADEVVRALRGGRSSRRVPGQFSRSRVGFRLERGWRVAWSYEGDVAFVLRKEGSGWRVVTVLPHNEFVRAA